MYYYSPITVNVLGMVDHAHKYPNGTVSEHMHCHMYTDAIGKKGANNVASLIMKTLRGLNLLKKDTIGCELNIIFDNCCGQNKNNTVLRLVAWLVPLGPQGELHLPHCWTHTKCSQLRTAKRISTLSTSWWRR